jgi:deoxyribonuclease-4
LRFGFHISIQGGLSRVLERARLKRCETIQFFSRNPRGWKYSELDPDEAEALKKGLAPQKISPVFLHMPYLANLASPDARMIERSVESLVEELSRAPVVGADYVVTHVGTRLNSEEEPALERVACAVNDALSRVGGRTSVLLEMTSGAGTEVGYTFGQIARIIAGVGDKTRVGVCLDTAHAFEAGYDLSCPEGLEKTLEEFEDEIGLRKLVLIHLNDSKTPLGSRVDRHWHIGKGYIGMKGMEGLLRHQALQGLPAIMETPRKSDREDLANLKTVERLTR